MAVHLHVSPPPVTTSLTQKQLPSSKMMNESLWCFNLIAKSKRVNTHNPQGRAAFNSQFRPWKYCVPQRTSCMKLIHSHFSTLASQQKEKSRTLPDSSEVSLGTGRMQPTRKTQPCGMSALGSFVILEQAFPNPCPAPTIQSPLQTF